MIHTFTTLQHYNQSYHINNIMYFLLIGLFPVCVEVEADVINSKSTPLTDVSVYGFVKDDDAGSNSS